MQLGDDAPLRSAEAARNQASWKAPTSSFRRTPGSGALLGLVERHELPLITSENRPDGVAPGRWCTYVLARRLASGREVADQTTAALDGEAAAMAMFDGLAAGGRRVPVMVAHTAFNPARAPAIGELLRAEATFCLERYPRYADHCAAGTGAAARDA